MMKWDPEIICQLDNVTDPSPCLQVLLDEFVISRHGDSGIRLETTLTGKTPCIISGTAKKDLAPYLDESEGREVLEQVEGVRKGTSDHVSFHLERFAFRHASAGVLPVLKSTEGDSTALFWRDIPPTGWNIANGASTSTRELAEIETVLQREFVEELLLFDPHRGHVIPVSTQPPSREGMQARELWQERLGASLEPGLAPTIQWEEGPDTLAVRLPHGDVVETTGITLILDVEAFGIECVRRAVMDVDRTVIPLDGEITEGRLLDRPIGLFVSSEPEMEPPRPSRLIQGGIEIEDPADQLNSLDLRLCPVTAGILARENL